MRCDAIQKFQIQCKAQRGSVWDDSLQANMWNRNDSMTYILAVGNDAGEDFANSTLHQDAADKTERSALRLQWLKGLFH